MQTIRNTVSRVGDKRIKEPSSYGTSNKGGTAGGGKSNDQQSNAQRSLHQSFSNLSIGHHSSSKGLSLWSPKESLAGSGRDRADSNCSRESDTSALDRFLTRHYESGVIKLSAKVSEKHGMMEFIVNLTVREFGSKEWCVYRSADDIVRFCERIRLAGAGVAFPMPPPAEEMMRCITKQQAQVGPVILPMVPSLGPMESHDSTSTQSSRRQSKPRHQKKKVNSGGSVSGASSSGGFGIFRAVSSRFSLGARQSRKYQAPERVFPSVQEWFDAALEVWQKRWHSKSDEDGISLAFEGFLCDPSGKTSAPIDLLTAVDFVVLVTASAPNQNPALMMNRRREATIAKAAIRLARDYPEAISIDALKTRVLSYAWEKFESNHPMSIKELMASHQFVSMSQEELPFLQLQVQPVVAPPNGMATGGGGAGVRFTYRWTTHAQLTSLKMNLIENFSVPPTPKSLDHFHEIWKSFTDVVLLRVEQRLRASVAPPTPAVIPSTTTSQMMPSSSSSSSSVVANTQRAAGYSAASAQQQQKVVVSSSNASSNASLPKPPSQQQQQSVQSMASSTASNNSGKG